MERIAGLSHTLRAPFLVGNNLKAFICLKTNNSCPKYAFTGNVLKNNFLFSLLIAKARVNSWLFSQ